MTCLSHRDRPFRSVRCGALAPAKSLCIGFVDDNAQIGSNSAQKWVENAGRSAGMATGRLSGPEWIGSHEPPATAYGVLWTLRGTYTIPP